AVDPVDDRYALVYGQGGLYRTTDLGNSWTPTSGTGSPVNAFAYDPTPQSLHEETVYAATGVGIEKSVDGGMTWQLMTSGYDGGSTWMPSNSGIDSVTVWALAVDPENAQTVWAAGPAGAFRSTDGGTTWERRSSGLAANITDVAIDPADSRTLFASANGKKPT